jgi:hypothetical protein
MSDKTLKNDKMTVIDCFIEKSVKTLTLLCSITAFIATDKCLIVFIKINIKVSIIV